MHILVLQHFPLDLELSGILGTTGHQWLTLVILVTQGTEIRRISIRSQPGQVVRNVLSGKNPSQKKAGLVEWLKL
jgi:hypothetical protein